MKHWRDIKYPVLIEGKIGDGDWYELFRAERPEDIDFRLASYNLVGDRFRTTGADGNTFEFDPNAKTESNEKYAEYTADILNKLKLLEESACQNFTEAALQTANDIIRGAQSTQHFQIYDRSVVLINHTHLHRLELLEFPDSVVCLFHLTETMHTDTDEPPAVTIFKAMDQTFTFSPGDAPEKVKYFACLLATSIVRDFWILEERTRHRVYQRNVEKTRERVGRGKDRKLVVRKDYTFLPRFQYALETGTEKSETEIKRVRVTLSPHIVSGHFRKLHEGWNASEQAKTHAEEFGLSLKDGYTFVRPHERGEIEQLRTYRSRSAFELIFATDPKEVTDD